jgi:hypothetical protein
MNKLLITAAAVVFATGAFATDLPSKKKAPAAPAVTTQAAETAAASTDTTISVDTGYEANSDKYGYSDRNKAVYNISATHDLGGGVYVLGTAGTSQSQPSDGALKQTIDGSVGYKLPTFANFSLRASAGIGERFTTGNDFGYYVLRGNVDYKINDTIQINAIQYRYRNAFDTANAFESHQIGTGLTYTFAKNQAVYTKVYRNFDNNFNATDNAVVVGYKVSF